MQTNLTKLEAHLIAGNGYAISVLNGKVFKIDSTHDNCFTAMDGLQVKAINFEDIGKHFWIACHPLSRITTEIEGIGVPIVELLKNHSLIDLGECVFEYWEEGGVYSVNAHDINSLGGSRCIDSLSYDGNVFKAMNNDYSFDAINPQDAIKDDFCAMGFDTRGFLERGLGKEITLKK